MPVLNLSDTGRTGPTVFSQAGTEKTVSLNIGDIQVTLAGGVFLDDATNSPADESVVYGTADESVGAEPGFHNRLDITFSKPVTNPSVNLLNGETVTTSYNVTDNLGDNLRYTVAPNSDSGQTGVGVN